MNTGSVLAQFTITLSKAVSEPVSVEWFTTDGTAKAGVDYAANKGTALFLPGETAKTVDILVHGRAVGTEDRSFYVEMLPPANAILGAAVGKCIIHVDTSGSQPVTQIIVPTGPKGDEGESAYQTWLSLPGNAGKTEQEFIDSLKPSPQEIAQEVAPLLDVGDTTFVSDRTENLPKPDATNVKKLARRVAYAASVLIATVTLADGDNTLQASDLTGDSVSFQANGFVPKILRNGELKEPQWQIGLDGKLVINGAVSGDVLYAMQYDFTSSVNPFTRPADLQKLRNDLATGGATTGTAMVVGSVTLPGAGDRNQRAKNSDAPTLEDFLAKGDGVNDDTAAIQKALDSGALYLTSSGEHKKYYRITAPLKMTVENQRLDLNRSELVMDDPTGKFSHLIIGKNVQMYGNTIERIVFTNKYPSTVYQVVPLNVGGLVVQDNYSYGDNKAFGFLDITRIITGYVRRNVTDSVIDSAVWFKGTGEGADRAVDVAVYDNRFIGGKHAARYGDYYEGVFFRRNICYAQTSYQLTIEPSSAEKALLSGKIQDNDFDSPQEKDGGIYIQFFKNVQITGNWFANRSTDPMIKLEKTDSVIIGQNQAYPLSTWLSDNGVNTTASANLVVGGITHVLYGLDADKSSLMANHMVGASSYSVNANNHSKTLDIIGNVLRGASGGIATSAAVPTHTFLNNVGDTGIGKGRNVTMGASPATYRVGPRPEILGFKGGTITNISVNTNQLATSSGVVIGPLPPGSLVEVSYTGATPGMTVLQTQ